jgi:flavoprotein
MYEVLEEVYRKDEGNYIEYPLNFASEILKMYKTHQSVENIYQEYKDVLNHRYQTVN